MTATSRAIGLKANPGGAVSGIKNAETGNASQSIVQVFKDLFAKPWGAVAELLDVGERCAKHRIAGTRRFSDDEIAALLRSDHGFEFLTALMGDARPAWWKWCCLIMKAASARRQRVKIAAELREALDADADLSNAISRAETALAFQDEDFMRPHVDAMRATSGLQNRAVATRRK